MGVVSPYSINVNGRLLTMERPLVMGVVNVTPDSFFADSRADGEQLLLRRCATMIEEGVDIIDVGGCSTRPSGEFISPEEELRRVSSAFELLKRHFPDAVFSVDTFRAEVARVSVSEYGAAIINDVSGFDWDDDMLDVVAELNVPYVLTHTKGVAGDEPLYGDFIPEVFKHLADKMWQLRQRGVKDILIDPGFGFGKSLQQNYTLMSHLEEFSMFDAPVLVGISRKSMITRLLGISPDEALNGTTVLNTVALMKGASVLRVHDVRAAREAVEMFTMLNHNNIL
ncbi:MAG: dihydropteroate synthase [Bacteroidaceae bacterium]|jgi:dihydropteroate synthase|nr:dihydropteroate synthase [Bacteroidaceae bacterium]